MRRLLRRDWHRGAVGGMWEEIGKLQFAFLVRQGLEPKHFLLDIGCGSLRGGIHFIEYLDVGHYYGIEKDRRLLEAGRDIELARHGLEYRTPHLLLTGSFDLSPIPQSVQFDFMLAQSVFTHLMPDAIELCLVRVMPRLTPNGIFYATYLESEDGTPDYGRPHPWRKQERAVVKYPLALFEELANRLGICVEYVGDWSHPRKQRMLAFRRG